MQPVFAPGNRAFRSHNRVWVFECEAKVGRSSVALKLPPANGTDGNQRRDHKQRDLNGRREVNRHEEARAVFTQV